MILVTGRKGYSYFYGYHLIIVLGTIILAPGATKAFGVLILVAVFSAYLPQVYIPNHFRYLPVELEIKFLVVIFITFVLGKIFGFTENIINYDKFMHFSISLIVALIGLMFMYTGYVYDKLKINYWVMAFIAVMVVMGIGSLLEIYQYAVDTFIYPYLHNIIPMGIRQGTEYMSPLTDTIVDMFSNLIGALFGAIIGVILSKKADSKGYFVEWVESIAKFTGLQRIR